MCVFLSKGISDSWYVSLQSIMAALQLNILYHSVVTV